MFVILVGCENQDSEETHDNLVPATITHTIDGDTVSVLADGIKEKVRIIGVDTPESTNKIEPYGKEASIYTEKRLNGRDVWLELDIKERDRYGRLLAYIWLEQPDSIDEKEIRKKMFNAELLLNGYAQVMTIPPNVKYADYFIEFQRQAREGNKGLWNMTNIDVENYYVASKNSNKFHRPDCRWGKRIVTKNIIKFESIDSAFKVGYEPCQACNP